MLDLIRWGKTYSLTDGTYCYWTAEDALGMAPSHRFQERGPMQHGVSDRGFRLDPRRPVLKFTLPGKSQGELYAKRQALLDLFVAGNDPVSLRWTLPGGDKRQIDCFYDGELGYSSQNRKGWEQNCVVSLRAPDPTFYDPTVRGVSFALGIGGDKMEVPTVVPMTVGTSVLDVTQAIQYHGNWRAFPYQLKITGPVTSPIITNETTSEVLDFTGTSIGAGDYYILDLRYGYKTVKDKNGVNRIDKLTSASDLETWHLDERQGPDQEYRVNNIHVEGSAATLATAVLLAYHDRYVGI